MSVIYQKEDAEKLLENKYILVMGGSISRSVYKDLVRLLQGNTLLTDRLLRLKGEETCLKDRLIDGGRKGKVSNGIGYREVREYLTDHHFLQFIFITRCYNSYVEGVLKMLVETEPKPDVIIINSCLWDLTRYDNAVKSYKDNLEKLFKSLQEMFPDTLVIWNTSPPVSKNPKGGVFVPEVEHLKCSMELDILEANYFSSNLAIKYGLDVLDLHYFLRYNLHRRAEDGIHWDMTAHRRKTNMLLSHIAESWGVDQPKHLDIFNQIRSDSQVDNDNFSNNDVDNNAHNDNYSNGNREMPDFLDNQNYFYQTFVAKGASNQANNKKSRKRNGKWGRNIKAARHVQIRPRDEDWTEDNFESHHYYDQEDFNHQQDEYSDQVNMMNRHVYRPHAHDAWTGRPPLQNISNQYEYNMASHNAWSKNRWQPYAQHPLHPHAERVVTLQNSYRYYPYGYEHY